MERDSGVSVSFEPLKSPGPRICIQGGLSGDSILNLLLYGSPESRRAASMGAIESAPCNDGAASRSMGEELLRI